MGAGDRAEHQDDGEEPGRRGGGVLEELEPDVARRQRLGGDPRADDDGGQQGAAQELGQQPSPQDGVPHWRRSLRVAWSRVLSSRTRLGRPAPTDTRPARTASGMQQDPSPAIPVSAGASASTV